jgi:putative transposase
VPGPTASEQESLPQATNEPELPSIRALQARSEPRSRKKRNAHLRRSTHHHRATRNIQNYPGDPRRFVRREKPCGQMVKILRESERTSVAEAKKYGVSDQTLYAWKKRFGAMDVSDAKRLKVLESENNKLKKLLAERDLAIEAMKEIAAKKW